MVGANVPIRLIQFVPEHRDVIAPAFRERFPGFDFRKVRSEAELGSDITTAEVLVINGTRFTPEVSRILAERGAKLRWIQFTTIGLDRPKKIGLPVGVTITNAGGVRAHVVATHAISLMLGVMRGYQPFQRFRGRTRWARDELSSQLVTPEGMTLVVIGMGAVGRGVARRAKAFDMRVIAVSRKAKPGGDIDSAVPRSRLHHALADADVVVVAAPLDPETRHFVDAKAFAALRPTAIVVNVSRGEIIDEAALVAALEQGRIAGAGLDVAEEEPLPSTSPLWRMENVVLSPHVAGRGGEEQNRRLADLLAENLRRYAEGRPLQNVVET